MITYMIIYNDIYDVIYPTELVDRGCSEIWAWVDSQVVRRTRPDDDFLLQWLFLQLWWCRWWQWLWLWLLLNMVITMIMMIWWELCHIYQALCAQVWSTSCGYIKTQYTNISTIFIVITDYFFVLLFVFGIEENLCFFCTAINWWDTCTVYTWQCNGLVTRSAFTI